VETFVKLKVSIVLQPLMEETQTRDKILEGTEALFMKYGIRSVTMDDIARHLSVSKKTLYQYFADKDELVFRMSEMYLERSFKQYEQIAQESKNSIDELSKISVCMKRDFENLNPSMLFDLQKYHPKAWGLYNEHKVKIISHSVVRNIRQGIEDGFYRTDISPDIMAKTRLILIEAAFNPEWFPKDNFDFIEVHTQLFDFFVHGLCTDKGKKLYQKYKQDQHQPSI
jgi:AcrR family transcriptional regulator